MIDSVPPGVGSLPPARGSDGGGPQGPPVAAECDERSAGEVDAALRHALDDLQRAEQNAVLCFAEIARRKLYLELGYATVHLYAAEALGFSRSRTYRFLRLAAELERLPRLRAAVASGEVGWTKARAVAKVAGPATEAQWIEAARRKGRRSLEEQVQRAQRIRAAQRRANPSQRVIAELCPGAVKLSPGVGSSTGRDATPAGDELTVAGADPSGAPRPALEPRADDAPVTVTYRLNPLQLARYETLIERIRRMRIVSPETTREELLLLGLEGLLASCEEAKGKPGTGHRDAAGIPPETGHGPGAEGSRGSRADRSPVGARRASAATDSQASGRARSDLWPRGHSATHYRIVIYRCDTCGRAVVQTSRGEKGIDADQLAAIGCDAVITRPGERNEATIAPSVRAAVLARDRHRCRAPGCVNARFLEVHHVVPRERGGSNRVDNLVTLCSACHRQWHARGLGSLFPRRDRAEGTKSGQRDRVT